MIRCSKRVGLFLFLFLSLLLLAPPSQAQSLSQTDSSIRAERERLPTNRSPLLGVVWQPPEARGPALRQLNRIHATGATAVRLTRLPAADTLFSRADTLGLRLFIDLPVSAVSAGALRDSLQQARPALNRLRTLAQRHASVQYVGLARHADTTVPSACSVLDTWTSRLHDAPDALRTYYVTPFPASADQCADAVDLTLIDTRSHANPIERWQTWTTDTTKIGLGTLGTWVHPDAPSGLRVPHSAERQARYLERTFSDLLSADSAAPIVVFVYRWQDRAAPLANRRYGLHDASGTRRPAANVVEGIYTDTQHVFAFPSGTAPSTSPHGALLFGWGLIGLLALLYAQSPFVRQTAFRYFAAHGFYRDAVRKGRDVSPVINTVLLLLAAAAFSVMVVLLTRLAATAPSTEHALAALPQALRAPLAAGLTHPGLTGAIVGGSCLLLLIGWTLLLVLAARRNTSFSLSQGFMLVTWPCWPVLIGLLIALVMSTQPPVSRRVLGFILLVGGTATILAITTRVLRDYRQAAGVSVPIVMGLSLFSPLVLLFAGGAALVTKYDLPLSFLWTLLTQT
mgnify:CR=1 FL=1